MSRFFPSPSLSRSPAGAVAGAALLAAAVLLAACGGPTATPLTDPAAILQAGAASLGEMKTVHVRGTVDGEMPIAIGGAGGAPVPVDGTTLEADVDVAGQALDAEVIVPALLNLRADLVVKDGSAYLKLPLLTGDGWVRQDAGGMAAIDAGAALDGLAAFLARPELAPEKLADARCLGTDCYMVRFTVPAAEIADALGSLGSAIPGLSGDAVGDATVTAGVRRDNLRLATLGLEIPVGGTKPLEVALQLSRIDEPVAIEPPPADEVKDAPGGILGG